MDEPPSSHSNCSQLDKQQHPAVRVAIANKTSLAIDESRVRDAASTALRPVDARTINLSVAIVDDATIRRLNKQFLNHDYATDVISFALGEASDALDGEIVASAETAARNACEIGWSADCELLLYIVHGALHLAGHDDRGEAAAARMRQEEARILKQLGVALSPSDSRWRDVNALTGKLGRED